MKKVVCAALVAMSCLAVTPAEAKKQPDPVTSDGRDVCMADWVWEKPFNPKLYTCAGSEYAYNEFVKKNGRVPTTTELEGPPPTEDDLFRAFYDSPRYGYGSRAYNDAMRGVRK